MDKDDTNNDPCDDVSGKGMYGWLKSNPTAVPKLKVHDKCGTPVSYTHLTLPTNREV